MRRKMMPNRLTVLALALILGSTMLVARRAGAQALGPLSPQGDVGTAFTYQGRLISGGSPVNATCDFRFNLYDDNILFPTLVAGPVDRGSVTVSDGYFSTSIDFGVTAFPGAGRQLEILVRCPAGSGSYTALSPKVLLMPAPYAHSLRPGATVSSATAGAAAAVLYVEDTYSGIFASTAFEGQSSFGTGVRGETLSGTGVGVEGKAASTGIGVRGESYSGYGVYGQAISTSGAVYGVYGKSSSTSGYGVYGEAANTSGGYGVYGYSHAGHGVHGKADQPDGVAVYSEGDAYVEGDLSWTSKTGYIAVSAAGFIPVHTSYNYSNWGNALNANDTSSPYYYAAVQLPQDATVTKLTFTWQDVSASNNATCRLYRSNLAGGGDQMAIVSSSGSPGNGNSTTHGISYAAVDNSAYAYYIEWYLPDTSLKGYAALIEYTFTEPY